MGESGITTSDISTSEFSFEHVTYSVTRGILNTTTNALPAYTLAGNSVFENSTNITMTMNWNTTTQMALVSESDSQVEINNITSTTSEYHESGAMVSRNLAEFWIGVALSVSSSLFIGLSFIIKKKALIRLSKGGRVRANQGGYGYLKDLLWWSGLLSMGVGEAANFMAYAFAPASLVSTLGVLSVLVTAILSSRYLNERLNFLGKVGCFLCAIGSTIIVIHAPMEKDIESMADLQMKLTNIVFVIYVLFVIVLSLILIYHYRPRIPETSTYTLLIWIAVCSMIGSLSVMTVKGLGLALKQTVSNQGNELGNWLTWFCFLSLIVCVSVQMNFLNKALDTFNTAVVTPIYYVFFTSCVIIASSILFNEFAHLSVKDWVGLICGFLIVLTAISILHLCKHFNFTLASLASQIDLVNEAKSESLHKTSTSCAIPVTDENFLKPDLNFGSSSKGDIGKDDDNETTTDELYKSLDSCGSNCSRYKSLLSPSRTSVSPDTGLLSGADQKSRRNKDGYSPLSYGTTDDIYH